ncbi:nuclease-related domain-containing protein [Streptomyces sp. NPDC059037]|uniref:nuclease-related domain-containing protein n=1 Tax=Streptomyces sp. NPDC059037 TaxID=3346710 RepID=UPI00367B9D91
MLTERGWRLLVDRRWPGTRAANVDMLLVGPGGVFVVDVKNWRSAPETSGGKLRAGGEQRDEHTAKLLAVTKVAEGAVASLGLSPVAVQRPGPGTCCGWEAWTGSRRDVRQSRAITARLPTVLAGPARNASATDRRTLRTSSGEIRNPSAFVEGGARSHLGTGGSGAPCSGDKGGTADGGSPPIGLACDGHGAVREPGGRDSEPPTGGDQRVNARIIPVVCLPTSRAYWRAGGMMMPASQISPRGRPCCSGSREACASQARSSSHSLGQCRPFDSPRSAGAHPPGRG